MTKKSNTVGRVNVLLEAYTEAADAAAAARAKRKKAREYDQIRKDYRRALEREMSLESSIYRAFDTVDNIGIFKTAAFDSIGGIAKFFSVFKNPLTSAVASGVGALNQAARAGTVSDLYGIVPGSTTGIAGVSPGSVLGSAGDAASIAGYLGRSVPAGPLLGSFSTSVTAGQFGADFVSNTTSLTPGGLFDGFSGALRSDPSLLGGLSGYSSADLRALSDQIRTGWDPGVLEELNGLSNDRLADSLNELADAKDATAEAGQRLRNAEKPPSTLEEANKEVEETEKRRKELAEQLEDQRLGINVVK